MWEEQLGRTSSSLVHRFQRAADDLHKTTLFVSLYIMSFLFFFFFFLNRCFVAFRYIYWGRIVGLSCKMAYSCLGLVQNYRVSPRLHLYILSFIFDRGRAE